LSTHDGLARAASAERDIPNGAPLAVERGPGAADCPDAPALDTRIATIRGHDDTHRSTVYVVGFKRTGTEFSAAIRVGGTSVRVLRSRGASCAALGNAVAVTLAMLIDADESQLPPVNEGSEPTRIAKAEPARARTQRGAPFTENTPIDARFSLGGSALIGVLGPIAPALFASGGIARGGARIELGALWGLPRSLSLGPGSVDESLIAGTLRGCVTLLGNRELALGACTGAFVGASTGTANGFTQNYTHHRPWVAVPVELSLGRLAGPMGWELGAAALAVVAEQDYAVDGVSGAAYRTPPFGGLLSLRGSLVFLP